MWLTLPRRRLQAGSSLGRCIRGSPGAEEMGTRAASPSALLSRALSGAREQSQVSLAAHFPSTLSPPADPEPALWPNEEAALPAVPAAKGPAGKRVAAQRDSGLDGLVLYVARGLRVREQFVFRTNTLHTLRALCCCRGQGGGGRGAAPRTHICRRQRRQGPHMVVSAVHATALLFFAERLGSETAVC